MASVLKSSTEPFRQLDRLLVSPPPLQAHPTPTPGAKPRGTSLHLRILRTVEYSLLSTRGEGLHAGSDARLWPPGSHVGPNPATRWLSDLAEGITNTFSRTDRASGLLRCRAPRPPHLSQRTNLHRTLKARRQLPPLPDSPVFSSQLQSLKKPSPTVLLHQLPGLGSQTGLSPPALPSATPFPSRRFPSSQGRAPGLGGFLLRHPAGPAPPAAGPAPARRAAHSPLSAEACRVAPEVPSMTLMVPRLVTARMALSAGW